MLFSPNINGEKKLWILPACSKPIKAKGPLLFNFFSAYRQSYQKVNR